MRRQGEGLPRQGAHHTKPPRVCKDTLVADGHEMWRVPPHPSIADAMGTTRPTGLLFALGAMARLGGCGLGGSSFSDRCGEMMQAAFPGGKIKVTKAEVVADPAGASVTSMIATVGGERRNVAESDVVARDVAI